MNGAIAARADELCVQEHDIFMGDEINLEFKKMLKTSKTVFLPQLHSDHCSILHTIWIQSYDWLLIWIILH